MRLTQSLFFLVAAALALAVGTGYAEDKIGKDENDPGFHALDKNKDGYISRLEAKGEPELAKNFDKWDLNNDGKLNRAEYLAAMAKEDEARSFRITSVIRERWLAGRAWRLSRRR